MLGEHPPLVFDRIHALGATELETPADAQVFAVEVERRCDGEEPERATVRARISRTAAAQIESDLAEYICEYVAWLGNSLPNDGKKLAALKEREPLTVFAPAS